MNNQRLFRTPDIASIILIRLMVGVVFLSEGIQKFLFPVDRGAGRFQKIGIPYPDFFGPFVGSFEIMCGLLILFGFVTRLAAFPLFIIMLVAIASTKIDILQQDGIWEMLHASRTDWSMLMGSIFLLIMGGGKWSVDHQLSNT